MKNHIKQLLEDLLEEMQADKSVHEKYCEKVKQILRTGGTGNDPDNDGDDDSSGLDSGSNPNDPPPPPNP